MTARSRLRMPMFYKFFAGCSALALLLIFAGMLIVRHESKQRTRVDYLGKHYNRYVGYQSSMARALTSVAEAVASDDSLARALAGTGATPDAGATAPDARAASERLFARLGARHALRPDLLVVFDRRGVVWSNPQSPLPAAELTDLEPIARVRERRVITNELLIHKGEAMFIAGVPIYAPGQREGDVPVGGVLLGVGANRLLEDFKAQWADDKEEMQHFPTLVDKNGKVVASTFARTKWDEIGVKLRDENVKIDPDTAGDVKQRVASLSDGDYDMASGPIAGYSGADHSDEVGTLYLLRSRSERAGRGPRIPWTEAFIGLGLAFFVATLLAAWITRPIKKFVTQSQALLAGGADLRQRIEITARDETADLADNINQVFSRLYELASEVQGAAFQVGASSAEISAASKNMLEGLKDQTLKIESSTAAVTELSASIQQVAQNALQATEVAEKSNVAVTSAVKRMDQIRTAVEEAGEKMRELGQSSKRIGNIVEVIRQISEQTSLLALNASIEAAHAGEQGRGFAVVADEVSSLARRVGQSAKDIESLIQTIKEQTADALQSMQIGTREVEQGTSLVTDTLKDLTQLIGVVTDTASAVQEQAEVSDEIARNMDAVQKIAAEMVAGSEEAVVQGEQLHGLAFALEQSVGNFNIEGGADDKGHGVAGARRVRPRAALEERSRGGSRVP